MKKNKLLLFCIVLFSAVLLMSSAFNIDHGKILKDAEKYRVPWDGMSLDATIESNNEKETLHYYRVFYKDDKTLVTFLKPEDENGNLLLMNGNDLWFYARSTSRPIRITPIQRLSGATSFGDLARLGWSKDYTISNVKETIISISEKPIESYVFSLTAKSSGATYQKIQLWINKINNQPIKSEVFLTSGKLYKTLDFSNYDTIKGKLVNTEIIFTDNFNKQKKSILRFNNINEDKNLPNRYFIKTMLNEVSNELSK